MLNFIVAPENWLFSTALCLMLMIGLVEFLGMGAIEGDVGSLDADNLLPEWMSIGPLPLSIGLILFLGIFAMGGIALQQVAASWTGAPLPALPAAAASLLVALPATHVLSGALARVLPTDETTAVSLESLIGRRGHIVVGTASWRAPARAKVRDAFGQSHYVLVEPHVPEEALREGDEILLIGREAGTFLAIAVTPHVTLAEGEAA